MVNHEGIMVKMLGTIDGGWFIAARGFERFHSDHIIDGGG